ncbi:MAG TPA: NAD-dependent succinate-semialdehyde dehydrogenase [Longimicrobiales bacterium]|nr:NAD-dependent succinate-semialdehyde dehydrogenase [Longimicrobiales bacterium]
MTMTSRNPTTGETLSTYDALSAEQLEQKLALAGGAFETHRRTSFARRAECMRAAADILERDSRQLGRLMTLEMGKPIAAAIAEAEKCAWVCRYYGDHAERFLADEEIDIGDRRSFIRYQPIGAVLAVMPWNFPFWQVFRFVAPAVMAGNVGLLKHASNVPGCALAIEDVMRRAGFDDGVFQSLLVESDAVAGLIRDPRVKAVTLTGSDRAGAAVAATAGECLKKSVLELGGSDPFIIMPSATLEKAAETAVTARTINNGQSCIAAKRFIIADSIYDRFVPLFVERMRALRIGDPLDEQTQIGPLATQSIRDELAKQVDETVGRGARLLTGGRTPERPGWFYEPTVLENIPEDSPAYRDELFGPVASLFRARDIDDAIRIANDSPFGLGSAAWTNDAHEQRRFIAELDAGMVFINSMVASDPRLPFGGVKRSGYGRELGRIGILEFVNVKSVVVNPGTGAAEGAEDRGAATE